MSRNTLQNNLLNYPCFFVVFFSGEFRLVLDEPSEGEEEDSGASDDEAGAAVPPG